MLLVLMVTVFATAAVTLRTAPEYESEALIFASTPVGDSAQALQGSLFSQQRMASYVDLVDSAPVAEEVLDTLDLSTDFAALRNQVNATVVPDTVLMEVTVTDRDPAMARDITNTTADVFVDFVNELEKPQGANATAPVELTVVNPAETPTSPVSPDPARNLSIAVLLGLLLGVGVALLHQAMDNSIRDEAQLEDASQAPLLGSIPRGGAGAPGLVWTGDGHDARAEALRKLRTNLRYVGVGQRKRVFVVTSSMPGEGKTFTAVNLAIMIAKAGQQVALIEGDLRRPQIADRLTLEPAAGLTAVLLGMLRLDEGLQQPYLDTPLQVLTSGSIPPNPAELIQSEEMAAVVDELREKFDVVIIDAPPLLSVTDGALLASLGDSTVLVIRHGKTTVDQVRHAVHQLQHVDAQLAGTVMTMVPRRSTGMGSGYYGYRGHRPSYDANPVADPPSTPPPDYDTVTPPTANVRD